jgi:hypothetical protein
MGTAMTSIWLYAKGQGFVRTDSEIKLRAITRLYIFASVLSTLIWLVSFVSQTGSLILFCGMFIIFVFPEKMVALQLKKSPGISAHSPIAEVSVMEGTLPV